MTTTTSVSAARVLRSEWPHGLLLAANVAIAAYGWATLPEVVPVHRNAAGEVDRTGGKASLLLLPLAAMGSYVLMKVLPRIDPGRANYTQFGGAYAAIRLLVAGLGNLMGKVRPNFFVGIRTPWTLTSKRAWLKTHRVGGWVMTGFGIALTLAGLLGTARV